MRDQRCDTAVLLGKRAQILRSAALPRLHEACHLQRVTALRGGQKGVSHGAWRPFGARSAPRGRGADTFFLLLIFLTLR